MKMLKKATGMVIASMLMLSVVLTGCGNKATSEQTPGGTEPVQTQTETQTATPTPVAEVKPLDPVELNWLAVGTENEAQKKVFDKVNAMIKEKINATIKFTQFDWGTFPEKLRLMIASSEKFDMCFTSSWLNYYAPNVANGAFLPLNALLDEYAPKLKASVPESIWNAAKVKGEIYGVINYQISVAVPGFWIRKDLADKYSFDTTQIKKFADIEPFFKAVKEGEDGIAPLAVQGNQPLFNNVAGGYDLEAIAGGIAAIKTTDSTLKVVNKFTTPEYLEFATLVRDWNQKGYIRKDAISIKDTGPDMKAGKYAAGMEGVVKPGAAGERKANIGYDVYEAAIHEPQLQTDSILGTLTAISVTSDNPERAMMALELMNTDKDIYNTFIFGTENEDYTKVGPNRVELIPNAPYQYGMAWMMGSNFNAYLTPGQDDNVWEETKKINASATPSPILGFTLDQAPIQAEWAQCQSVVDEMQAAFDTGTLDPKTDLQNFITKLEAAGSQKIVDEIQRQIDAWSKTK